MRSRYLAAAILALTLPIAVFHAVSGPLVLAFLQVTADAIAFVVPVAFAAGGLAIIGVIAQPRAVSYKTAITAGKLAEHELRSSEHKFAKAFRANPVCMAIVTVDEGRYMDVNEGYERLTGYSREEVIGRTVRDIGYWVDPLRPCHDAVTARARRTGARHRSSVPQEMR